MNRSQLQKTELLRLVCILLLAWNAVLLPVAVVASESVIPMETGIKEILLVFRLRDREVEGFIDGNVVQYGAANVENDLKDRSNATNVLLSLGETRYRYHPNSTLTELIVSCGIDFPKSTVKRGDVIPACGAVCRVTEIGVEQTTGRHQLRLAVLDEKQLPANVRHPRQFHAIPLGGEARIGNRGRVKIARIERIDSDEKTEEASRLVARITVHYEARLDQIRVETKAMPERWVRENDVIAVPDNGNVFEYAVRGMVPPDSDRRIIGWILIEPLRVYREGNSPPTKSS